MVSLKVHFNNYDYWLGLTDGHSHHNLPIHIGLSTKLRVYVRIFVVSCNFLIFIYAD